MSFEIEKLLDTTGWRILEALQENARLSFAELGRMVGLSSPAVAERVRKMEEVGIITGYGLEMDSEKVRPHLLAFVRLSTTTRQYPQVIALAQALPEILECHHVTGNDSFIVKVAAPSMAHLETIIARLSKFGATTTSIVLSSPVKKRPFVRNAPDL